MKWKWTKQRVTNLFFLIGIVTVAYGKLRAFCGDSAPKVIQCAEGWCILRCRPEDRDETISLMSRIDPESKSLRTSGTLITLRRRYPRLMETRPPARR